jgi:hypothetical protein
MDEPGSEFEQNEYIESFEPTLDEVVKAAKDIMPLEDFEPMFEACKDDIGAFLGAIYSFVHNPNFDRILENYLSEGKSKDEAEELAEKEADDLAQDYLIEKGLM